MRCLALVLASGVLAMTSLVGTAGPAAGPLAIKKVYKPGAHEFSVTFKGGQRACVIVVGDHDPVVRLQLQVFDANNKLVALDQAPGDFAAVMWYPPRDAQYRIRFQFSSEIENICHITVK